MSLLSELGAIEAYGEFSGGNDEGFMDHVYLVYADGREQEIYASDGRGAEWTQVNGVKRPIHYNKLIHPRQRKINNIHNILWRPVEDQYGGFAGSGHVSGTVRWDGRSAPVMDSGYTYDWDDE